MNARKLAFAHQYASMIDRVIGELKRRPSARGHAHFAKAAELSSGSSLCQVWHGGLAPIPIVSIDLNQFARRRSR
jgi:hypothetical protein